MARGEPNETLISFESGHYKKVRGTWQGDSVWSHFKKDSGGMLHINKDKVEYMESFESADPATPISASTAKGEGDDQWPTHDEIAARLGPTTLEEANIQHAQALTEKTKMEAEFVRLQTLELKEDIRRRGFPKT